MTDTVGRIQELLTEDGTIAWRGQQRLWGREESRNKEDAPACRLRFPGQYEDEESGLYYNRFRYYDCGSGQYLCADPAGLDGGINPYGYVKNPLKYIDPLGLCKEKRDFYVGPSGPSSTMPSTAYRCMNSTDIYATSTIESKSAPLSYFGYTKYESGHEARNAYQIFYENGNSKS